MVILKNISYCGMNNAKKCNRWNKEKKNKTYKNNVMLVYSSCLFVFLFFLQVLLLIATLLVSLSFLSYCHVVILWSCFLSSFFSTLYCCHLSICHRFFLIWTFSFYFLFVSLPFFLLFFHLFYLSNLSIFIFILLFIN